MSEGSIWWIVDGYSMDSIDQGNLVDRWWIIDHWWIVSPGLGDGGGDGGILVSSS